jgi:hypothetical protein
MDRISEFELNGESSGVKFIDSLVVVPGVVCDVYEFIGDVTKDLALVQVEAGRKTPRQKVSKGDITIEGYLSGEGTLTVDDGDGEKVYTFPNADVTSVEIKQGSIMQWSAGPESPLVFYEICTPPYEEGRFKNIEEL